MLIVIDANEIFSLLIKGTSKSESIFFSEDINLIAPEFLMLEFSKNEEEILSKTHRSKEEFLKLITIFKRRIRFIPKEEFLEQLSAAKKLFPEHLKDSPYLALALKFNCSLWTEEKLLKKQNVIKVLNTFELFKLSFPSE